MELIDRGAERRLLDGVLRDVRSGQSGVRAGCWCSMVIPVWVSRRWCSMRS